MYLHIKQIEKLDIAPFALRRVAFKLQQRHDTRT